MANKVWGDYDQESLDTAYNARASVPDFDTRYVPGFTNNSAATRRRLKAALDVSYGPHKDQVLDVFPAEASDSPVNVFIHGGYWRMLTKDENSYVADALTPAGATMVVNTYSLCPDVHLDVIVRQCRDTIAWTYRNIHLYGGNARRLYVTGHSAGGHLAAMMLSTDWEADYGLPADLLKGVTCMSGLFEIEPLRHAFTNEWLQLSEMAARRNSPIHHMPRHKCPVIVAWGGAEPEGFGWQSNRYADALEAHGCAVTRIEMDGLDHFAVGNELMDAESPLTKAIAAQMELGGHSWKS